MNVSPLHANAHAPNSGGRSPGSQTPGDPATPSPPCGGGQPWPCACAEGPTNLSCRKPMSLHDHRDVHNRRNCTCSTSEQLHTRGIDHVQTATADLRSFLSSEPNGTVVAQQRAVNDLVQGRKRGATVGSRLSSHRLHLDSAGPVQERHRTHRQWTATGESLWSLNSQNRGNCICATHNNGHVNNITKNRTCGNFTAREEQHENRPQEPSIHCRTKHCAVYGNKKGEHSTKCVDTSKTSPEHTTAAVDTSAAPKNPIFLNSSRQTLNRRSAGRETNARSE